MALYLSTITFTEQDDVVPSCGVEEILNSSIVNTLAGNDLITGTGFTGFSNYSTLNTDDGNDILTGNGTDDNGYALINTGVINTGNGEDIITATANIAQYSVGLDNFFIINTGEGDDIITGTGGIGIYNNNFVPSAISTNAQINTGEGNDTITSIGVFRNEGNIKTGNGNDSIFVYGSLANFNSYLGDSIIDTGNGNDIITSSGSIINGAYINTGNGNDSIIADGGIDDDFLSYGTVFLGDGKDCLKGFGSGDFYGGNGKDTLELTPGSYTVGISGTAVNFTKDTTIMNTSEFEKLIAGCTTYDFSSLTDGQTIFVA